MDCKLLIHYMNNNLLDMVQVVLEDLHMNNLLDIKYMKFEIQYYNIQVDKVLDFDQLMDIPIQLDMEYIL